MIASARRWTSMELRFPGGTTDIILLFRNSVTREKYIGHRQGSKGGGDQVVPNNVGAGRRPKTLLLKSFTVLRIDKYSIVKYIYMIYFIYYQSVAYLTKRNLFNIRFETSDRIV